MLRAGITPAHAGKSAGCHVVSSSKRDHPRTRGEKTEEDFLHLATDGSPPHTRGKGCNDFRYLRRQRITPAHAGKSLFSFAPGTCIQDHPRTRGEKLVPAAPKLPSCGSPPHTRGKAADKVLAEYQLRITPAHAGKSFLPWPEGQKPRDHPRTRGEKAPHLRQGRRFTGSPPHTRGKVAAVLGLRRGERITPAHAGKSPWLRLRHLRGTDHPRTRGEKSAAPASRSAGPGSPPHTRGKGCRPTPRFAGCRITPAHAGKSSAPGPACSPPRDHPRTRGEKRR